MGAQGVGMRVHLGVGLVIRPCQQHSAGPDKAAEVVHMVIRSPVLMHPLRRRSAHSASGVLCLCPGDPPVGQFWTPQQQAMPTRMLVALYCCMPCQVSDSSQRAFAESAKLSGTLAQACYITYDSQLMQELCGLLQPLPCHEGVRQSCFTLGSQMTFLIPSSRSSSASISCLLMLGFRFLFSRHSAVVTSVLQRIWSAGWMCKVGARSCFDARSCITWIRLMPLPHGGLYANLTNAWKLQMSWVCA